MQGDALLRLNRAGFPTSSIAVLTFGGSWQGVENGAGKLTTFWAPHAAG
ncbi:hypothetical protein ACF08B_36500 [Streptomyces sp. NPDC015139]